MSENREILLLRLVYEAARSLLRFNGIDHKRTLQAMDDLNMHIDQVMQLDGGNYQPPPVAYDANTFTWMFTDAKGRPADRGMRSSFDPHGDSRTISNALEFRDAKRRGVDIDDATFVRAICGDDAAISEIRKLNISGLYGRIGKPPVDLILYCPACGLQHIDEPHPCSMGVGCEQVAKCFAATTGAPEQCDAWRNPPHRSHLCTECGYQWRPADIPTQGVRAITTKGRNDSEREAWRAIVADNFRIDLIPEFLVDRIKEAERRLHQGYATTSIPFNVSDVDLVLAECRLFLSGEEPPFWIKELDQ